MARLYEYQGKELLKKAGIHVARGGPASSPEEARKVAESLGVPCVVKAQAWVTGRASSGLDAGPPRAVLSPAFLSSSFP